MLSERSIFIAALDRPDPADRAAFLREACGPDAALRGRIEALLDSHSRAGRFLNTAAVAAGVASDGAYADPVAEGPGSRVGPYKLLEKIGEGGMGVVFMAEAEAEAEVEAVHGPAGRRVAVKIIKPGLDPAQVAARLEAERQALALMDHPNIAKVLDAGSTASGRPFLVMELVHGVPITRFCDDRRSGVRERLELFTDVCRAVQHAHQKGVIHRDVKPSNVLVTMYDGRPVPKVIDFGVAKAIDRRLTERTLFTRYGVLVGTFEYMAPEQAELSALGVDTRSDVYSLGVLLYELLTGTTPLGAGRVREAGLGEVLRLIREDDPPAPSTRLGASGDALAAVAARRGSDPHRLTRSVRGELDWIVMRCLEKDRARRYETAHGLARDVERYLADEPVAAGPPGVRYRLGKFARRNKGRLAAGSAVAAALLLGLGAASAGFVRARAERDRAVQASAAEAAQRLAAERARALAEQQTALAQRNEGTAKKEAAKAEAVSRFLQNMLWPDRPNVAQRADLTLRQVLDRAAAALDRDPTSRDPAVDAAVRESLGRGYLGLGLAAAAEPHLRLSLDTRRRVLGEDHPDTAMSLNALGVWLSDKGDYAGAESHFRQALAVRRRAFGDEHANVAYSLTDVATTLAQQGKVEEAEALSERATAILQKAAAGGGDAAVAAQFNRGVALLVRRSYAEAETVFRGLADRFRGAGPREERNLATALRNLGLALVHQNDPAAEGVWREALALTRRSLGEDHPYQIPLLNDLVELLAGRGDRAAADAVRLDVLRVEVANFTQEVRSMPRNPHAALARADRYARLGRFDDARADRERAMALDPDSHDAWFAAAIVQLHLGDVEAYRGTARGMLRRFAGSPDPEVAERAAKVYLLGPPAGADVGPAVELIDRALAFDHIEVRIGWFELTKALAEYRAGRFRSSLDWLARLREHGPKIIYGDRRYPLGTGLALAAMAHHRLGQPAEASRYLDESARLMDQCPEPGRADLGTGPDNWLVFSIILREARDVLSSDAATSWPATQPAAGSAGATTRPATSPATRPALAD